MIHFCWRAVAEKEIDGFGALGMTGVWFSFASACVNQTQINSKQEGSAETEYSR